MKKTAKHWLLFFFFLLLFLSFTAYEGKILECRVGEGKGQKAHYITNQRYSLAVLHTVWQQEKEQKRICTTPMTAIV